MKSYEPQQRVFFFAGAEDEGGFAGEVGGSEAGFDVGEGAVVDVGAALGDGAAGFGFGFGEAGFDEGVGEGEACGELVFGEGLAGDVGEDVGELGVGEIFDLGAEENVGGFIGGGEAGIAVDEAGELFGEAFLTFAEVRLTGAGGVQGGDLFVRELGEEAQGSGAVGVGDVDPVLVEGVGAGFAGIEVDGAALGLAHLRAVGLEQERAGHSVELDTVHAAGEVDAGGDVAPLVAAADLKLAAVVAVEMDEVVGLKEHVGEFGVADAAFATQAVLDRVLGEHDVDGEVFSNVAKEVEEGEAAHPVEVVEEEGAIGTEGDRHILLRDILRRILLRRLRKMSQSP